MPMGIKLVMLHRGHKRKLFSLVEELLPCSENMPAGIFCKLPFARGEVPYFTRTNVCPVA